MCPEHMYLYGTDSYQLPINSRCYYLLIIRRALKLYVHRYSSGDVFYDYVPGDKYYAAELFFLHIYDGLSPVSLVTL